ncbi:MAG: 50S ribosomal protein L35 [Bacteroidota bacterium]
MPKTKSSKSARKRFSLTASGKVKRRSQNRRHILTSKSKKRKRQLKRSSLVFKGEASRLKSVLQM